MRALFTFDGSEQAPEYAEHSGEMVTVGECVWNVKGDEMSEEEANLQRFALGDVLRKVIADDGWIGFVWETELGL